VLVERDQVANDSVVEFDRALVLWKCGGVGGKASDGVVTRFAASDRVSELAPSPVIHLQISRVAEKTMEPAQLVVNGGVLECRVEDVDRLILARHALAILPLVVAAPRWLPEWGEGKFLCTRSAEYGSRVLNSL